jgi:hypothetical protein
VYVTHDTDLIIDIDGYFQPEGGGGLKLYSLQPCRVLDTRSTGTQEPFLGTLLVNAAGSDCKIPLTAGAVVVNATVLPSTGLGFLSLWADGQPQPYVSTLSSWDGSIASNMALVPTGSGAVNAYASNLTHLILDVSGYFAP